MRQGLSPLHPLPPAYRPAPQGAIRSRGESLPRAAETWRDLLPAGSSAPPLGAGPPRKGRGRGGTAPRTFPRPQGRRVFGPPPATEGSGGRFPQSGNMACF